MLTQILWWASNVLQGLLLLRAVQGRFFKEYPVFYVYLGYVLLESLLRFYVYALSPGYYQKFYWQTQFVSVAFGYGVILQIYSLALAHYPGAKRMARNVLLVLFVAVVSKVAVNALSGPLWSFAKTTAELERDLRVAQAILLVAIVGLLVYYGIPSGRNLKGMIFGYGFFISTSVIHLALRSYLGDEFQIWWRYLQPAAYLGTLLIWSSTLWSYDGSPQPESKVEIERDYEFFSERTTKLLTHLRDHLLRPGRP